MKVRCSVQIKYSQSAWKSKMHSARLCCGRIVTLKHIGRGAHSRQGQDALVFLPKQSSRQLLGAQGGGANRSAAEWLPCLSSPTSLLIGAIQTLRKGPVIKESFAPQALRGCRQTTPAPEKARGLSCLTLCSSITWGSQLGTWVVTGGGIEVTDGSVLLPHPQIQVYLESQNMNLIWKRVFVDLSTDESRDELFLDLGQSLNSLTVSS